MTKSQLFNFWTQKSKWIDQSCVQHCLTVNVQVQAVSISIYCSKYYTNAHRLATINALGIWCDMRFGVADVDSRPIMIGNEACNGHGHSTGCHSIGSESVALLQLRISHSLFDFGNPIRHLFHLLLASHSFLVVTGSEDHKTKKR